MRAHCGTRMRVMSLLKKPELADEYLEQLVEKLFTDRHSIMQIIHHSELWTYQFGQCVKELEDKVGHDIRNVKAAKHRHESAAKPRGRFVLNMDAFIQVALHIVAAREDGVREDAQAFLRDLTEEMALQAAMLADAADEGLYFTRQLDEEAIDSAATQQVAETFARRLQALFLDRACLQLPGYTTYMLKSLERPRVFQTSRSSPPRTLGGPSWPNKTDIINRCMSRMQKYVKLAIAVTIAEFPSFELCCAFRVFHLEEQARMRAAEGAALARHDDDDRDWASHLEKLALFFHVDAASLTHQFTQHRAIALHHKKSTQGDNATAWQHAIRASSVKHHCLDTHPAKEFVHVVMRYLCFSMSTAGVEQNFSVSSAPSAIKVWAAAESRKARW